MWVACPVEEGVDLWYLHAIALPADFLELTVLAGTWLMGWVERLFGGKPSGYQKI